MPRPIRRPQPPRIGLMPHAVVGDGRAATTGRTSRRPRAPCAPPAPACANGRRPIRWAGLMQAQHRIMTKEATQSYAKERARFSHLFSPIMHGVMAEGDAVNRRQYADASKRKRIAPWPARRRLGASSTCCWRPRPRARRRRAWAIPAIRSSTASGRFSARPASRCPSTPGRSACPCRCSSSARAARTTSSSPGRAGWSASSS